MTTEDDISQLSYVPWIQQQAGVLAWLPNVDPVQFVIVTSRRTGRWVFPKGGIDDGMTAAQTAAQEALEEAGLIGPVDPTPVGLYRIPKIRPPHIWTIEVELYAMQIDEILDQWIEIDQRVRRFVTLEEAHELLAEPEMIRLAETFCEGRNSKA